MISHPDRKVFTTEVEPTSNKASIKPQDRLTHILVKIYYSLLVMQHAQVMMASTSTMKTDMVAAWMPDATA
jgi:hypothetical protein